MTKSFDFKNIRALLTKGFDDGELRHLCYDSPVFRPVHDQLAQGMSKNEIIDRLIEYAERKQKMEILLKIAKERNLTRYETHGPYYKTGQDLTPVKREQHQPYMKEQFQQDEPEPPKPLDDEEIKKRRKLLQDKLDHLRKSCDDFSKDNSPYFKEIRRWIKRKKCPFAIVGSVYLDIRLNPGKIDKEEKRNEWITRDSIKVSWGGSSLLVSRYLWKLFEQKCYVYSMIGNKNDPLTRAFERLIKNDKWFYREFKLGYENTPNGVTVQLHEEGEGTSFVTDVGVLHDFGWSIIERDLVKLLKTGGVLYISGYFKTKLYVDLIETLRRLPQKEILICVDHGRLVPSRVKDEAIGSLKDAFSQGLIDIYFCTLEEFRNFYDPEEELNFDNLTDDKIQTKIERFLKNILECNPLPPITIIRDNRLEGPTKAYAILENSPCIPLNYRLVDEILNSKVDSPRNAFNAVMIHNLIFYSEDHDSPDWLKELIETAAKKVPKKWPVKI